MTENAESYVSFLERTSTQPGAGHPAIGLLEAGPGRRCLDGGCGLGEDARAINRLHGAEVVGIDRQPRMVAEALARSAGLGGLWFLTADATRLPFAAETFDCA